MMRRIGLVLAAPFLVALVLVGLLVDDVVRCVLVLKYGDRARHYPLP